MHIKPGSIVEMLELGPEPIDPKLALYYASGTQHLVIDWDPITWEVELINPDKGSEEPGEGVTFFAGEYKLIVE